MDKNTWTAEINKLMLWQSNSWRKYNCKASSLLLRVHYDQLLITADSTILERFNMLYKMKGIYKDDILILIVSNAKQEIRKIKLQFKSNANNHLKKLGEHFPVLCHSNLRPNVEINSKYRNIDDILQYTLDNRDVMDINVPRNLNSFLKICLLDPTFPQMVFETEQILTDLKKK